MSDAETDQVGGFIVDAVRRAQWVEILGLTDQMLALAQEEEWESVARLQERRWECLQAFFRTSPPAAEQTAMAQAIRDLLERDKAITSLGEIGLENTREALNVLGRRRQADKAYGDHR